MKLGNVGIFSLQVEHEVAFTLPDIHYYVAKLLIYEAYPEKYLVI